MKRFTGEAGVRIACWFGLASAFAFQLAQPASGQTQEKKLSGAFAGFGTVKHTHVGKDRLLLSLDQKSEVTTRGFVRDKIRTEIESPSIGSQRSTRQTRKRCAEGLVGQVGPGNTLVSVVAERIWTTRVYSPTLLSKAAILSREPSSEVSCIDGAAMKREKQAFRDNLLT